MIDLHTHTIFSDGELIPAELGRRAEYLGLKGVGITDHCDMSNIDFIIPRVVEAAKALNPVLGVCIIPGIEITHVPPPLIGDMVEKARRLGARLVSVHGESIVEPFIPGTNKAGILASIDVLSHPGLITEEEVRLAKEKNVLLEISARKGHCLGNGHVARLAKKIGAKLVISTDAHAPSDLIDETMARKVALGAGLTEEDYFTAQKNAEAFL